MRFVGVISLLMLAAIGYGCVPTGSSAGKAAIIQPGERPDPSSVEAGLWMAMDKYEEQLKASGRVLEDRKLNLYVRNILCKLTPEYCSDIRLYIIESPNFNASMAPNGVLTLWTGMLLRVSNEAQLAFVLGHETAHYLNRHSLQSWRDARSKVDAFVFIQLAAVVGGAVGGTGRLGGLASDLAGLLVQGSIFAFSRDNERDADQSGLEMVVKAGYDPGEAPKIWEALMMEVEASDKSRPSIFFSSHPTEEERVKNLTSQAQSILGSRHKSFTGRERYQKMVGQWRANWLREELQRREYAVTQVLLDRLIQREIRLGELYFFQGELYRLRDEEGENEKAIVAYRKALDEGNPPAEIYRSMGLVLSRTGDAPEARQAYKEYLRVRPDAEDRKMVEWYISELK